MARRLAVLLLIGLLLSGQPDVRAADSVARILRGHTDVVWSVAFSPDGKELASASEDGDVRIWDVATGKAAHVLRTREDVSRAVAFTPDGRLLAAGRGETVQIWTTDTWSLVRTLTGHTAIVVALAVSPDGQLLATGAEDDKDPIRVWAIRSGKLVRTLPRTLFRPPGGVANALAFSPDGHMLASGSDDRIELWDVATGMPRAVITRNIEGDLGEMRTVAWSPDGRTLAGGGSNYLTRLGPDLKVTLWDSVTGAVQREFSAGEGQAVQAVAFSPDGRFVAAGTWKTYEVHVWAAQTVAPELTYTGHIGYIMSVAFSPDGNLVASGSADTTVRLWPLPRR